MSNYVHCFAAQKQDFSLPQAVIEGKQLVWLKLAIVLL